MVNGVSHAVVAASILSQASELMRGHRTLIGECPWLAPACTEYQMCRRCSQDYITVPKLNLGFNS
jgi:hypothetical protein